MILFTGLKAKLYAAGAVALAGLLFLIKFLLMRNSYLERKTDTLKANVEKRQHVAEMDVEIEKTRRKIREQIKNDPDSNVVDTGRLWGDKPDD